MLPCRAWRPEGKKCYICNKNCDDFRGLSEPRPRDLLESLTCDPDCEKIVVSSSGPAAVWQNKRTGLFRSGFSLVEVQSRLISDWLDLIVAIQVL